MQLGLGFHGITSNTPNFLNMDSGVLYKNVNENFLNGSSPSGTPWLSAIEVATVLGATREGASFDSGRTLREVEVDGSIGPLKDMIRPERFDPILTASLLEFSETSVKDSMGSVDVTEGVAGQWNLIQPRAAIDSNDYFNNIAWAGKLSGQDIPVVLVLNNVMVAESVPIEAEDHNEVVLEMKYRAHFLTSAPHDLPWRCYYPAGSPPPGS